MRRKNANSIVLLLCGLSVLSLPLAKAADSTPLDTAGPPIVAGDAPNDAAQVTAPAESTDALNSIPVSVSSGEKPVTPPRTNYNAVVEEVVVTAQKREERLQDVPISIQAFSGDAIAARGIETTEQLGQAVPGLQFTNAVGFSLIFMRGIGSDNFIPSADPSIATYVDGIYIAAGHSVSQSLGNVERVEVLKGPQGTLFGRNATGGAISIITEEPGDVFKGSVEGELGNFNSRSGKFSVSGPITDWASASLSGLLSKDDGYYTATEYDIQKNQTRALRLKVNLHPTDDLSLSLTGYTTQQDGPGTLVGKNTDPTNLGRLLLITPQSDDRTAVSDYPAIGKASQEVYYGNLVWQTPWLDLKLLGSRQFLLTDSGRVDFDGSPIPIAAFDDDQGYSYLTTGEVQFISNDDTPFAEKLKWVVGLYYLHSNAGLDPAFLRAAPGVFTAASSILSDFGLPIPQSVIELNNRLVGGGNTPLGEGGLSVAFRGLLKTDSYSAYTQGTYYFNDWFDLTLGGRFQHEKRFLTKSTTELNNFAGGPDTNVLINWPLDDGEVVENFSPKAVLSFHPRENALIYASYTVGFKSGTYNIVNIYTPPNYIVPEEVTTYEVGVKVDFFDRLLRLNGAIFNNEISNLQTGFVSLLAGGAIRFQTAGSARTRGAEIYGTLVPMPDSNPGLAITGNLAYIDAIYTDFRQGSGFQPDSGLYSDNLDFTGNRIVRTPKVSGGVGANQSFDCFDGGCDFGIDTYYNSGFFYDAFNTVEEGKYVLLNAQASYTYEPLKVRVTLFGKNLLDRQYHVQQLQTDFGVISTLAPPLEYGLRLGWEF